MDMGHSLAYQVSNFKEVRATMHYLKGVRYALFYKQNKNNSHYDSQMQQFYNKQALWPSPPR